MNEPIDPERSEVERNLWHTLDEAGWSADQIRESFAAYRSNILRKAAEKIRAHDWDGPCANGCCTGDTPEAAADLIDPGTT